MTSKIPYLSPLYKQKSFPEEFKTILNDKYGDIDELNTQFGYADFIENGYTYAKIVIFPRSIDQYEINLQFKDIEQGSKDLKIELDKLRLEYRTIIQIKKVEENNKNYKPRIFPVLKINRTNEQRF